MSSFAQKSSGLTLIEVLLTIAILVLVSSAGIPQLALLKAKYESQSIQHSLLSYLASARARALHRQQIITLCPLSDQNTCSKDWNQELSIFVDPNANAILETDETLISVWNEVNHLAKLSWTLNRTYIRFRPNGSTTATAGSLRYCTPSHQDQLSFRLVIARTGRARVDRKDHGC